MARVSQWSRIRLLRTEIQQKLDNAYIVEKQALRKLEKADKLMLEASIHLNNAKRTEDMSNIRQKRLDQAFIKLNKSKAIIERRGIEQSEHDLFKRENIAQI